MQHKTVAVAGENKRNVECAGVVQRLLHAVAHGFEVVFGLDQRNGKVPNIQHIVRPLGFAARDQLAPHDDAARRERHLAADGRLSPAGLVQRWRDEFGAGVIFAEVLFHPAKSPLEVNRVR